MLVSLSSRIASTSRQCHSLIGLGCLNAERWYATSSDGIKTLAGSQIRSRSITTEASGGGVQATSPKQRVVILGSGWAGYALAKRLDPEKFDRIVISPRSYFVFTPLLASTSVGTLEFRSVLEPVRRLRPTSFHQGWADDIDFASKVIRVETNPDPDELSSRTLPPPPQPPVSNPSSSAAASSSTQSIAPKPKKGQIIDVPYDKLVISVGAYSQTFGIPGVREHANFLRDVGDARSIRLRILRCFESADLPSSTDAQRKNLLHFAVVGGGPTGIEFAAELHDLIHDDLSHLYPSLMPFVAITVYDIAPKVLPMFDKQLANYAVESFKRQGIKVKTEHHLQSIRPGDPTNDGEGTTLRLRIQECGDEEVGAGIVVWSTGLMQNPFVQKLLSKEIRIPKNESNGGEVIIKDSEPVHIQADQRSGGIITDDHLRVTVTSPSTADESPSPPRQILPDVFAVGDCAVLEDSPLPATAQVASQQAIYLAKALNRQDKDTDTDNTPTKPFRFRNLGTMAYLGSWNAIHQSSWDGLKGRLAWVLWRMAYLTRSMSLRNKVMVPVYWAVTWIFGRDISRF